MKKSFMILGATLLALAAVGCQNDIIDEGNTPVTPDEPIVEEPAEVVLYATLPESRTTLNADYSVEWRAEDDLSVFYQKVGEEGYSPNTQFIIDEELTGKFTPATEVTLDEGANYNWYVCSPHSTTNSGVATLTAPNRTEKEQEGGYFAIGATNQYGYNNSDHIADMDIMVGKAEGTRTPSVALKHLAVLHKFTVTNNSNAPTAIKKLTVTGNTNIFGAYWIDLTADEPAIDLAKANNTAADFNTRALNIKDKDDESGKADNDDELAVGESADFYMITAPFTLGVGETFTIKIETSTGEQTFTKTAAEAIEFKAGTYNTAKLTYDYEIEYADHLYYETWNTAMTVSGTTAFDVNSHTGSTLSSGSKTAFNATNISTYATDYKDGLSVYDGDNANITYSSDGANTCLSKNNVSGVTGTYVWFRKSAKGWVQVDGIKLYGNTALTLSYAQQGSAGGAVKAEYSLNGTDWTTLLETNTTATQTTNFTVAEGSETISLRFTENGNNNVRIDDIKLTWQATE